MKIKYKWQQKMFDEYNKLSTYELVDKLAEMAWFPSFPQEHRDEWEWRLLRSLLMGRVR